MNEPGRAAHTHTHPYEALTPDVVLDALASVGLAGDGRLMALSSYENRVYQIHLDETPGADHDRDGDPAPPVVVAKFYRPDRWSDAQIDEEHAFAAELAAAEVPCVAPLALKGRTLHHHAGFAFAVYPRQGGRRPELDDPDVLERIGRFLARIHLVGQRQAFTHRPALDARSFGELPREWLLRSDLLPPEARAGWEQASDRALRRVREIWDEGPVPTLLRLHGDCHPGNILWTEDGAQRAGGAHFVDLDDARMGPAVQDLWMLLSGDGADLSRQRAALLEGYTAMRDFDPAELRLVEPLRTLRLLHYSVWLAQRRDDPAFVQAFPWFGSAAYWQGQSQLLLEQVDSMDMQPL